MDRTNFKSERLNSIQMEEQYPYIPLIDQIETLDEEKSQIL